MFFRVALPRNIERYTILKSPHIYKKHRVQYEIRTHRLLIQVIIQYVLYLYILMIQSMCCGQDRVVLQYFVARRCCLNVWRQSEITQSTFSIGESGIFKEKQASMDSACWELNQQLTELKEERRVKKELRQRQIIISANVKEIIGNCWKLLRDWIVFTLR